MSSLDSFSSQTQNLAAAYRELRIYSHENGTGVNIDKDEFDKLVNGIDLDVSFDDLDRNSDGTINEYDIGEGEEFHALRHAIRTGEGLSDIGDDFLKSNIDDNGTPPHDSKSINWGGEEVDLWAITKDNATDSGITDGADAFLVTVNDTSLSTVQRMAEEAGYDVIDTNGKSDAGVLFLRPTKDADPKGFDKLLDYGKVTVTAVNEPEDKQLKPKSGGFETKKLDSGIGFGTTDDPSTRGEFFKTDGGNSTIEKNREDDGRLWQSGSDMKHFRGGWMSFKWD